MNEIYLTIKEHLVSLGWGDVSVQRECARMARHPDLAKEFFGFLTTGKFPEDPIREAGYTAEEVFVRYGKKLGSEYAAYGYMIALRENRESTLSYIRRGFPLK